MEDPRKVLQQARLISAFIRHADTEGQIDSKNEEFWRDLDTIIPKPYQLDTALYDLNRNGTLTYEEIGEDGFAPIVIAGITEHSAQRLTEILTVIDTELTSLRGDLKDILTFDPHQLSEELMGAQLQIKNVKKEALKSDLLKPLLRPLEQIEGQLGSVNTVASNYIDVYKNIIRPVQKEGESGIKATVRWAVFSILASTFLSWLVSNWSALKSAPAPSDPTSQSQTVRHQRSNLVGTTPGIKEGS